MLADPIFGCCGRTLKFGWFTLAIIALIFSGFSTKRYLRTFLYRSLPSATKAEMRFVGFSSTSSTDTKLLSFTASSVAYGFPRPNMNCKTLHPVLQWIISPSRNL